jgi:hypothetical protein
LAGRPYGRQASINLIIKNLKFAGFKIIARMSVYKFKVAFEDNEEVSREIEIKPSQTFEDFHKAIQASVNFDATAEASFYTADDYWRKEKKISFEEFSKSKIAAFIEGPRQKFLYEYDPNSRWNFTVELQKILQHDPDANYPRCVKSTGKAPSQYLVLKNLSINPEDNGNIPKEEEIDDSLFYTESENIFGQEDVSAAETENRREDFAIDEEEGDYDEEGFQGEGNDEEEY